MFRSRTCLCAGSGALSARELFKRSEESASLVVCNEIFFASDVISAGRLDLFGPIHLVLGPNHLMVLFRSSFSWN